jgi:hypothetical protein
MSFPLQLLVAAGIGTLSGTHASIWGMYKDAPHEGFTWPRFFRSIVLGAALGVFVQWILRLPLPSPGALFVLFGVAYGAERGVVEVWKTFIREEDQSKYFIPMQFAVGGVPVVGRGKRLAAGAAYVVAVAALLTFVARLDRPADPTDAMIRAALIGLVPGMIVAISGCWKDAPKEGFDLLKFFRSPIMTVVYAVALARVTDNYLAVAAGAIGLERATAETYKTFFFPSKPRGKFSGKPILYPEMLRRRQYFVPAYVAICASVLVWMYVGVTQ